MGGSWWGIRFAAKYGKAKSSNTEHYLTEIGDLHMSEISFADVTIVSSGTLSMELQHLKETGFLDTGKILYTTPGLHQDCRELERQLVERIEKAKTLSDKVIVVYGGKFCYVNVNDPSRTMERIISEQGTGVARIDATHCMDMMASEAERREIANGEEVWWMTPGWIKFRHQVFAGWDKAIANENFPRHSGGAVVLDAIGYLDGYMEENPEEFLEYSDWMGIPILGHSVKLNRFKSKLVDALNRLKF
jgi:hypothetical protein